MVTHNWRLDLLRRYTMKRDKSFDAVKTMRKIRDKMSKEIKGMSAKEQIEYIEKKSGFRREEKNSAAV
jgi:hypothetical protein